MGRSGAVPAGAFACARNRHQGSGQFWEARLW